MWSLLGWGYTTIEGFSCHFYFLAGCVILVELTYLGVTMFYFMVFVFN